VERLFLEHRRGKARLKESGAQLGHQVKWSLRSPRMALRVESAPLHVPNLEELATVLQAGLRKNFAEVRRTFLQSSRVSNSSRPK
jgi:hypothetical protein